MYRPSAASHTAALTLPTLLLSTRLAGPPFHETLTVTATVVTLALAALNATSAVKFDCNTNACNGGLTKIMNANDSDALRFGSGTLGGCMALTMTDIAVLGYLAIPGAMPCSATSLVFNWNGDPGGRSAAVIVVANAFNCHSDHSAPRSASTPNSAVSGAGSDCNHCGGATTLGSGLRGVGGHDDGVPMTPLELINKLVFGVSVHKPASAARSDDAPSGTVNVVDMGCAAATDAMAFITPPSNAAKNPFAIACAISLVGIKQNVFVHCT